MEENSDFIEKIIPEGYLSYFEYTDGELILEPVKTIEEVYKIVSDIMDLTDSFRLGSDKLIGNLKSSDGYKKQIGIISKNKKVSFRIDYDIAKSVHLHYTNNTDGKKTKYIRIVIPIEVEYQQYLRILKKMNKV